MVMRLMLFGLTCAALAAQDAESAMAANLARQANRLAEPVVNQDVQDYVAHLGAKLSGNSALTFSVVNDARNPPYEPVMVPQPCMVSADLILAAKDEAELAGMLAQAIARGFRWIRSEGGGMLAMMYFPGGDPPGLVAPADVRDKIRAIELQADRDAVARMAAAGYDPAALAHYLERVQLPANERSLLPPPAERVAAIEEAIRKLPSRKYAALSGEFDRIQALLRRR